MQVECVSCESSSASGYRPSLLIVRIGFAWLLFALNAYSVQAAIPLDEAGKLTVYGDFRSRAEADWDSRRSNGSERDDRNRIRIRLRVGINYQPTDQISLGLRVRSGSDDSQQSPHITVLDMDNNSTGDADFNFDKWYFKYSPANITTWVGRNSLPFWKPDALLWDDDVTPAGVAVSFTLSNTRSINSGYFANPAGMEQFTGNTGLAQVVWDSRISQADLLLAGGLLGIDADREAPSVPLANNNSARDYQLWFGNLQVGTQAFEKPLKLDLSLYHNGKLQCIRS